MLKVVADEAGREDLAASLDEIVREGARRMLAAALEDEVAAYIAAFAGERDEAGRRLVVRNGHARPRQVTTAAGAVEVRAPRVDDRRIDEHTGGRARFRSQILPPWCRKSPKITEVLPLLYLHGLSTKDFVPALEQFLGSGAGLSASAVTRLTECWQEEYRRWCERDLSHADYVYCWADGIHFGVRLDADRVCTLVVVGVRADGKKELVALADGHRESTESWAGLLRDARRRGMRAPGAGGRGWGAGVLGGAARGVSRDPAAARLGSQGGEHPRLPAEIGPARGPQGARADPRRRGPRARREGSQGLRRCLRRQVPQGGREDHRRCRPAARVLRLPRRALDPPQDVQPDRVDLLHRPAQNQGHQGPGSRAAGLAMVFKLIEAASERWRYVNGPHLVALVRAGAKFEKGVLIERPDEAKTEVAA